MLLEDISPEHDWISYYMKIWTDHFSFLAESKGGACRPSYEWFIVTSNYTIDEVFAKADLHLKTAIYRRFHVIDVDTVAGKANNSIWTNFNVNHFSPYSPIS